MGASRWGSLYRINGNHYRCLYGKLDDDYWIHFYLVYDFCSERNRRDYKKIELNYLRKKQEQFYNLSSSKLKWMDRIGEYNEEFNHSFLKWSLLSNLVDLKVIEDITMNVAVGEKVGLIGPNGAGKTTLFNMIAGDLEPSGGKISYFGKNINKMTNYKRTQSGIVRTFQKNNLMTGLTVKENLITRITTYEKGT